jgi:hypothetical protein
MAHNPSRTSPTAISSLASSWRPLRPTSRTSRWASMPRAIEAADHLIAALKVPVGGKPSNAMRGRRQDDIDDRNA